MAEARIVIVGAGICGLQLAAALAADGREVLVLEKGRHVGGRAFLWEKEGFKVDNGIHLVRFGPKSATARVFRKLGRPLEFRALGKSFVGFPDGRVVDFPTSPGGFLSTKLMSAGERLRALALMLKIRKQDPQELLETSVKDWMDQNGIQGGVRQYLHLVSASMQVCPFIDRASAGEMLLNMQEVLKKRYSAMYPVLGWSHIYDALLAKIGEKGEVRTETKVKRVLVEEGKAKGVELESGESVSADLVVVNKPVQELFEVLDESLVQPDYAALCKNLAPTAGVSIDYGLSRKVSSDEGLWYFWEPMSFGLFTSNLCPRVAPPGKQLLTWFYPTERKDMEDPETAKAREQELEEAIFRQFPGLADAVEWRRAMHLKMVDGVEVNTRQHRGRRPGVRVPGVDNLFLVGDSLNAAGAGGDIGHESVLLCYRELTGREL